MAENETQDQIDEAPSSLDQDRANFAQRTRQGLDQYLGGVRNLVPKSSEQAAEMAAYATPGVGNILSARDAYNAAQEHDWLGAALGAVGAVPVLGGIIAGPLAKTANHEALAMAKEMQAAGHTQDAIHGETGWWQGPDSKWRFEIPDNEAQLADTRTRGKFTEVKDISHPELEAAYRMPDEIGGGYGASYPEAGGWYNPPTKSIEVYGPNEEAVRSSLLHELQHHVQHTEGFTLGGNPRRITPEQIAAERARLQAIPEEKGWGSVGTYSPDVADTQIAHQLYRRIPGEIEARNVQTRANMTPRERSVLPPWKTEEKFKHGGSISNKTDALLYRVKRQDGGPTTNANRDIPTIDPAPLIPKTLSDLMPNPPHENVTGTPTYGGTINPFESKATQNYEPLLYGVPYLGFAKMAQQLPAVAKTIDRTEEAGRIPGTLTGLYDKISSLPSNLAQAWRNGIMPSEQRVQSAVENARTDNAKLYAKDPEGYLAEVKAHALYEPTGPGEHIAKDEYIRQVPLDAIDKVYRSILADRGGPGAFETTTASPSSKRADRLGPGGFETRVVPAHARGGTISDKTHQLLAKLKKRA